jgi:hypothetical protein
VPPTIFDCAPIEAGTRIARRERSKEAEEDFMIARVAPELPYYSEKRKASPTKSRDYRCFLRNMDKFKVLAVC